MKSHSDPPAGGDVSAYWLKNPPGQSTDNRPNDQGILPASGRAGCFQRSTPTRSGLLFQFFILYIMKSNSERNG